MVSPLAGDIAAPRGQTFEDLRGEPVIQAGGDHLAGQVRVELVDPLGLPTRGQRGERDQAGVAGDAELPAGVEVGPGGFGGEGVQDRVAGDPTL
jgi:hypothetical protein